MRRTSAHAHWGIMRPNHLRDLGKSFRRSARAVTVLILGSGFYSFFETIRPLLPDAPENLTWGERRVMAIVAVVTLGGAALAAWVIGQLLRATSELIEVFLEAAEAVVNTNKLIETQLAPGLVRATAALERMTAEPETTVDDLRVRLDAARTAEDPERVLDCRDALTRHLRGTALEDLDRRVARWMVGLVQRRIKAGEASPALAATAARAVEDLGDSDASLALRDALPELRRRAGLCPECAQPVAALGQICPACRAAARAASTTRPRNSP
jgi:hypothetical protein